MMMVIIVIKLIMKSMLIMKIIKSILILLILVPKICHFMSRTTIIVSRSCGSRDSIELYQILLIY